MGFHGPNDARFNFHKVRCAYITSQSRLQSAKYVKLFDDLTIFKSQIELWILNAVFEAHCEDNITGQWDKG